MKHAIIVAHPNPGSLTHSVAHAYAATVATLGQPSLTRDLYALDFDPRLKASEIPRLAGYQFGEDVVRERKLLEDADAFAFVYPFWFNAPPAILKGYVDRVFSMGFGFGPGMGGSEPLLQGRRLISISFSGAPEQWVRDTGALRALTTLFDHHLSAMCGLQVVDHLHFGGIVPDMNEEAAKDILSAVDTGVRKHFGGFSHIHAA